ncbi:MAG: transcription elongation factor subunit Spt4 [Candidatus Woesearchaeota archaeon]
MKKVCKKCRIFFEKERCPVCNGTDFSTNWQGKIVVIDPSKSEIAKKLNFNNKGEYAIRVK